MPKYDKPPAHRLVQRRDGSFNVLARNDSGAAGQLNRGCSNTRDFERPESTTTE